MESGGADDRACIGFPNRHVRLGAEETSAV